MTTRGVDVARWCATPIAAVLGAAVTQVLVFQGLGYLAWTFRGDGQGDWIWAVKTMTSVFMGATFVAVAWEVAPHAKREVALVALGVVVLWGLRLIIGAFDWPFGGWLAAMGLAGIGGGAVALWLEQRRGIASA